MNSDWEKLRRFAMQLFPAGYAERCALKQIGKDNIFERLLKFVLLQNV